MKQTISPLAQEIAEAIQNQPKPAKMSLQDYYISVAREKQKSLKFYSAQTAITAMRNGEPKSLCIAVVINNAFMFLDAKTPANITDVQGKRLIALKMQIRTLIADVIRTLVETPETTEKGVPETVANQIFDSVARLDSFLLQEDVV
jgi:hypothetical protein